MTQKQYYLYNYSGFGIRHDTHCEKYCKRSDTYSETAGVLLTLEYHTAGKGSKPIRFKD